MAEKFRNQVRFQNGQVIDLAILKPGFELARLFQNLGRFQNGQVNNLAVSKRPGPHVYCTLSFEMSISQDKFIPNDCCKRDQF